MIGAEFGARATEIPSAAVILNGVVMACALAALLASLRVFLVRIVGHGDVDECYGDIAIAAIGIVLQGAVLLTRPPGVAPAVIETSLIASVVSVALLFISLIDLLSMSGSPWWWPW